MSWISSILPTIGTLLGGPLGGAAVDAVGKALGISDATEDKVKKMLSSGQLSADQMAALQKADLELKTRMAELGIDAEKIAQADRASARDMQSATHSWVPSTLAIAVTTGYFGILIGLMSKKLELGADGAMTLLLGALTTAWGSIVAYYYGASPPQVGDKK
jgi:hypothetical protein